MELPRKYHSWTKVSETCLSTRSSRPLCLPLDVSLSCTIYHEFETAQALDVFVEFFGEVFLRFSKPTGSGQELPQHTNRGHTSRHSNMRLRSGNNSVAAPAAATTPTTPRRKRNATGKAPRASGPQTTRVSEPASTRRKTKPIGPAPQQEAYTYSAVDAWNTAPAEQSRKASIEFVAAVSKIAQPHIVAIRGAKVPLNSSRLGQKMKEDGDYIPMSFFDRTIGDQALAEGKGQKIVFGAISGHDKFDAVMLGQTPLSPWVNRHELEMEMEARHISTLR